MSFFHFGVATEANNYEEIEEDKIFIRNEEGELVLLEGENNDDN